jgi:hypothetical protein
LVFQPDEEFPDPGLYFCTAGDPKQDGPIVDPIDPGPVRVRDQEIGGGIAEGSGFVGHG